MSLQARLSESDPRLYNANRDVAHNFREVVMEIADRLENERWPELKAILDREGTTMDELGKACEAYCRFVAGATHNAKESMVDVLARSGWWDVSPAAQVAYMSVLGTVISGYYFAGAREATLGGVGPTLRYEDLAARGGECARLMQLPFWRRWWHKKWHALRSAVNLIRG